jgi:hypothetical protein
MVPGRGNGRREKCQRCGQIDHEGPDARSGTVARGCWNMEETENRRSRAPFGRLLPCDVGGCPPR